MLLFDAHFPQMKVLWDSGVTVFFCVKYSTSKSVYFVDLEVLFTLIVIILELV